MHSTGVKINTFQEGSSIFFGGDKIGHNKKNVHTNISPVFCEKRGQPTRYQLPRINKKIYFLKKLPSLLQKNYVSHQNIISLIAKIVHFQ